jgi:7,8-dihydropterin-6-yl-methyl-4-(beta-D-ribofuranosyl)aminobenzene 5'-phosphate synthase
VPGVPHLSGIDERIIPQTVKALGGFGLDVGAADHRTGWRAMTALTNAFGDAGPTPLAVASGCGSELCS